MKFSPTWYLLEQEGEFLQFAWADRQYVMRKRQWP